MTTFDLPYFQAIQTAIQTQPEGVRLDIRAYTKDFEKFIFHLKYYMDATCNPPHVGWKHIELVEGTLIDNKKTHQYTHFVVLPLVADINGLGGAKMTMLVPIEAHIEEHPYRRYVVKCEQQ